MSSNQAIAVLREVKFDWVRRLREVWLDDSGHVPQINREAFEGVLAAFAGAGTQLGRVMVGPAGAGKTHLLGALRAAIAGRGWFVLVDMTDVRDFWETVLQGYLESLREPLSDGRTQFQMLLHEILAYLAGRGVRHRDLDLKRVSHRLAHGRLAEMVQLAGTIIGAGLAPLHPGQAREFQDVLRAVLLLNATDFDVSNLGHSWLLGLELNDAQRRDCGFTGLRRNQKHVVQGLSWLMSLTRPTLLALDQMDAIVSQHHAASQTSENEDQQAARAILHGIGNGLLGLHDTLQRTLTLLSCLTSTWEVLRAQTTEAVAARFDRNMFTLAMADGSHGRLMVEARLAAAYQKHRFRPPYPSWPFRPEAFEDAAGLRPPREILIDCATHRDQCVAAGSVRELVRFGAAGGGGVRTSAAERLQLRYAQLIDSVGTDGLVSDDGEDERLGMLVANACVCAVREQPPLLERDLVPEIEFPGQTGAPALHARLRIVDHDGPSDNERHYCFRVLNRSNSVAFQNRVRLAMTASGIGANLSFRRLVIIRNAGLPDGDKAQAQIRAFTNAGGRLVSCTPQELACLLALEQLCREEPEGLDEWLRWARPASSLGFLRESGFVTDSAQPAPRAVPARTPPRPAAIVMRAGVAEEPQLAVAARAAAAVAAVRKSPSTEDPQSNVGGIGPFALTLLALPRHVAILGSPGAGKTVLLRRLLEEAALMRVPAVVIDAGNDLARLADPWPQAPQGWGPGDEQRASNYLRSVEVRVFTPGKTAGRPLNLAPLPDLTGLTGEELDQAIEMTVAALAPVVAPTQSATAQRRKGLLAAALKHLAGSGGRDLEALIGLLSALPPAAAGDDSQAPKLAADMADLLRSEAQGNPLWRQSRVLSPSELLGISEARTRISVISLTGLGDLAAQQAFVNALAVSLFAWIRRHPAKAAQPLRGLLVIDEVKDFVPARQAPPAKDSLLRLAAQGRRHGLGLVLASEEPQSVDPQIVSGCATQICGKAASLPAIERVRSLLQARGGDGHDIARLTPGQFYVSLEGSRTPAKMVAPMCLSWHPGTPLTPEEVLVRASGS